MKVYKGDNPSQLYLESLTDLIIEGDKLAPRGKEIKEIRPVAFEFTNPLNRVTFLKGRKANPFFQLAESLWILGGRSDVNWLEKYNRNMKQFSDDGVNFNAPYGERLRFWGKNNYRDYIYNPYDQLVDVYEKIKKDKETRQAVAVIYNPAFDNISYGGKDTPCNLVLTFKVRQEKLHLTVYNRSNDVHWGVFGANLNQFATIQEVVARWLGLPVGTYSQITDSLHVYTEDYGAKATANIMNAYDISEANPPAVDQFQFPDEPRIDLGIEEFSTFLTMYFSRIDPAIQDDETIMDEEAADRLLDVVKVTPDPYFRNALFAMLAYRGHRLGVPDLVFKGLGEMKTSQWKVSCLHFLYKSYKDEEKFVALYDDYQEVVKAYIEGR